MSDDLTSTWAKADPRGRIAHWFPEGVRVSLCGHSWRTYGHWRDDRARHCQHCTRYWETWAHRPVQQLGGKLIEETP